MNESPAEDQVTPVLALNDRDLLRRFVQDADESAFAEIVRRHQGLVIGVCRRVIGNGADVDDAFQATFLALARRPRQVRNAVCLSSWLYTVAWRTSWRLVKQRRKNSVEPLTAQPLEKERDPLDQIASAQDCLVLDEELNSLPSKYRQVLVMTYFSGQGSQQIADQLNVSKGTVDGRIRQARNMLRVRLARRGVAIGALAVAVGFGSGPSATAAPALLESTIQLGAQTLSGSLPGTTDLSHLEPFIRPETAMLSSKLIVPAVLCAAVIGIAGMRGIGQDTENAEFAEPEKRLQTDVSPDASDSFNSELLPVVMPARSVSAKNAETIPSSNSNGAVGDLGHPFAEYSADAAPVEKWMHEMLDKTIPPLDFPGETPLSEVLETIQVYYTTAYGGTTGEADYRMRIHPDAAELDLEGLTSLEDVSVSNISFEGISLRSALSLIFEQTTDPELTWEIDNEVMKITTVKKANGSENLLARVYNVAKLLELDPAFRATSNEAKTVTTTDAASATVAGQIRTDSLRSNLASVIIEMTPSDSWDKSGGAGAIRLVGNRLLVRQTPVVQRQVVRILNLLRPTESGPGRKRDLNAAMAPEWPTSVASCQRPGGNPEQFWFVEFADQSDQQLYLEQLDFLKIQLGCVWDDARVTYLSSLSTSPVLRETNLNDEPRRIFTHWSDDARENADAALFTNAGVSSDDRRAVFHVYDPETQQTMSRLELEYRGNPPGRILRTLFRVRPVNGGFEFYVADQQLR